MHDATRDAALFEYLLRLGDNALVLAQRLTEWCGHGPALEEDIALSNVGLDLLGQARYWLTLAGQVEGAGRDEDALAFRRDTIDFRNALIVELPRGDFARTTARQFLFDHWHLLTLERLARSDDERIAGGAAKAVKEVRYHVERSNEWICLLGDGTAESHERIQRAIEDLWPYTGELFESDDVSTRLARAGVAVDPAGLHPVWDDAVSRVIDGASLQRPADTFAHSGGFRGVHTEHLGYLLAEMQFLQRAYPEATW